MWKRIGVFLLLFLCSMSHGAIGAENNYERKEREAAEAKSSDIRKEMRKLDAEIRFYGKVLDQLDQPVGGADVVLHVTRFSPSIRSLFGETKELHTRTDPQGKFSVINEKGRNLWLDVIKKDGYVFSLKQDAGRDFRYSGEQQTFIPIETSPIVFRLRKTSEPTFLLETEISLQLHLNESGQSRGMDLIKKRRIDNIKNPISNGERLTCDFQVSAIYNDSKKAWGVVLSSGTVNGGIIASEQQLYEAPDDGYQSEYRLVPEDRSPVKAKYLYLRSRDPAVYTRIELEDFNASPEFFRLNGTAVTNPYGNRNLERAVDLPWPVEKSLRDDVKSAFQRHELPLKPDLHKMISIEKQRVEGK